MTKVLEGVLGHWAQQGLAKGRCEMRFFWSAAFLAREIGPEF